jgi:hypothetical protein
VEPSVFVRSFYILFYPHGPISEQSELAADFRGSGGGPQAPFPQAAPPGLPRRAGKNRPPGRCNMDFLVLVPHFCPSAANLTEATNPFSLHLFYALSIRQLWCLNLAFPESISLS